jgi:predicted ATP-grasp superfamily ATP-dependent carboligase
LIIALSARPFVEAAVRAGYSVTAIDAFADAQTVALAEQSIVVGYCQQGFDAEVLFAAVSALELSQFAGWVYGSGFESQPALLHRISTLLPLIGNSAEAVAKVKTPAIFFTALRQLNIKYPKIYSALPDDGAAGDYLIKLAGGCGGTHIKPSHADFYELPGNYYFQQKIDGRPVSLLFIADDNDIELVGFNEQWLNPCAESPYRYGGAVSNVKLTPSVQQQLISAAKKLTDEFGLMGLNSLDAIVQLEDAHAVDDQDERIFILEINPRLSATVDLYAHTQQNLFKRHVQACLPRYGSDRAIQGENESQVLCKAHAIVYVDTDTEIMTSIVWPDWVVDNPVQSARGLKITAGEPVCTVIACAASASAAKELAQARVGAIRNLLQLGSGQELS